MPRNRGSGTSSTDSAVPLNFAASKSLPRSKPSVFIFSDVRLYREGLALSLSRQTSITISGAASATQGALSRVVELKPDVVIFDVGGLTNLDPIKSLCEQLPAVKIIAFAVNEIEEEVFACATAGFAGYVLCDGSEADLMAAIEYTLRGELYCSPRVAGLLFRHLAAASARQTANLQPTVLTQRERLILELLAQGMSNKEIARDTRISSATVKNHVHNILEKLHVRRRGEAAAKLATLQMATRSSVFPRRAIGTLTSAPPHVSTGGIDTPR